MSVVHQEDEYIITLPSNAPGNANNTISNYITALPQTLNLHGNWEVGLAEIIYVNSADTIAERLPIEVHRRDGKVDVFHVPPGNYETPAKLTAMLKKLLPSPGRRAKRATTALPQGTSAKVPRTPPAKGFSPDAGDGG